MTKEKIAEKQSERNEQLEQLRDEYESSPFWKHMGITMDQLTSDHVRIKLPITDSFLNLNGTAHGGLALTLIDSIMGVTLRHQNINLKVATISMTTQFIAPAYQGNTLYATARIVRSGSKVAFLEASVESEDGRMIASGIGNFVVKGT